MRTDYPLKVSLMAANQSNILDLNGMIKNIMCEYVQAEEEVHLEHPTETVIKEKLETQPELEELVEVAYFRNRNSKDIQRLLRKMIKLP